jgi:cysteine desulfuration protein SufE
MTQEFASCLEKQEKIKKSFSNCSTPNETYQQLIELGRTLPLFPEEWKKEENLVSGCQSRVYLHTELSEGKILFHAEAEALISAGLVALLIAVYSGEPPEAILSCPPDFLKDLGLHAALTPGRSHGLASIHLRMKQEALKKCLFTSGS